MDRPRLRESSLPPDHRPGVVAPPASHEYHAVRSRRLGHGAGGQHGRAPPDPAVDAQRAAMRPDARRARQPALSRRCRVAAGARDIGRFRRRAAARPRRTRDHRHAHGGAARDAAPDARAGRRRARRAVVVQGLRAWQRKARARDRAGRTSRGCAGRRRLRPELCDRSCARAADSTRRGERRRLAVRRCRRGAAQRVLARLHVRRRHWRRSRRCGEERARHRHRHRRRPATGAECPGRADHARTGRDDAARCGTRRTRRNLHGPFGARRPRADRHRRPVAQSPGRPAARERHGVASHPAGTRPCRRRRAVRRHRARTRASAGRRDADHPGRRPGAPGDGDARAGARATDGAQRTPETSQPAPTSTHGDP